MLALFVWFTEMSQITTEVQGIFDDTNYMSKLILNWT